MAYLYRHIRLDKNEPFYIGIGSDMNRNYKRAYNKKGRSYSWKDIAYHHAYEVEILIDDLSWEEACQKEIEFITLYGRKDLGLGSLVNMTNGGDGQLGRKVSEKTRIKMCKPKTEETKQKLRIYHQNNNDYSYLKGKSGAKKGIAKSKEHIIALINSSSSKRIKIFCPELNLKFNSLTEASKILNKSVGHISNILYNRNKTRDGITLIKENE